jgi:hypothetical protein
MNMKIVKLSISVAVFGLAFCLMGANQAVTVRAQSDKPVEQVNKNIQVLKGLPSSQLLSVMHFMRTSLGVRCDYCHIAENDKYWMDDKPAKQIARQMIQMTAEINKRDFGGKTVVTCNTCHQGRTVPISVPPIGQGSFADTTREDPEARRPDPLPTVEQILDRHAQAVGGRAATDRVQTRFSKSSMLRAKLVNGGTPKATVIARGQEVAVEIYQKAPNKYLAVITTPNGVVSQGFNGKVGWVKTPDGAREMGSFDTARIKRQADLYRDFNIKDYYASLKVTGKEKIGEREAYVVEGAALDDRMEKLFFDVQTGLLVRRIIFTPMMLGLEPEQTDFEDYREVNGVKLPFIIRGSYLDDNHLGTTRKVIEVKQNIAIDDAKFDMPSAKQ